MLIDSHATAKMMLAKTIEEYAKRFDCDHEYTQCLITLYQTCVYLTSPYTSLNVVTLKPPSPDQARRVLKGLTKTTRSKRNGTTWISAGCYSLEDLPRWRKQALHSLTKLPASTRVAIMMKLIIETQFSEELLNAINPNRTRRDRENDRI